MVIKPLLFVSFLEHPFMRHFRDWSLRVLAVALEIETPFKAPL